MAGVPGALPGHQQRHANARQAVCAHLERQPCGAMGCGAVRCRANHQLLGGHCGTGADALQAPALPARAAGTACAACGGATAAADEAPAAAAPHPAGALASGSCISTALPGRLRTPGSPRSRCRRHGSPRSLVAPSPRQRARERATPQTRCHSGCGREHGTRGEGSRREAAQGGKQEAARHAGARYQGHRCLTA